MDLPRLAKTKTASMVEPEVLDNQEANRRTSTSIFSTSSRFVEGNIRESTQNKIHIHKKPRDVARNSQDNTYGDLLMEKNEGLLRIGFQNFNGLSGKENDPVDKSLCDWIMDNTFDVFGISEVNMYWPRVRRDLQFQERVN